MASVKLNDGTTIPIIAFGSGTALYGKDATKQVVQAIQAGFRHIDAAQMYRNEESVGEAIVSAGVPRSELYITTKLGKLPAGQTVRDTLVESLRKLKVDYVDLFLIHMPNDHPDLPGTWKQFEELKKEGLTKSIGVSNAQVKHLTKILDAATIVPAVNQIEYHPYTFKASIGQVELHKKHAITGTSYGGLSPIIRYKGGPIDPILSKVVDRLSSVSGKPVTEGQVLHLWLRKKGFPVITTSSKLERLQEYLAVAELPDITDAEEQEIDEAGSTVHHRAFATWIDTESRL